MRDSYGIVVGGGRRRVFRGLRKVVVTVAPFRKEYKLTLRANRDAPVDLGLWAEPRIARDLAKGLEAPWLER